MEQTAGNSCIWRMDGDIWKPDFKADLIAPANSQLRLVDHDGWSFFTDDQQACPPELQPYVNDQVSCIPMFGGAFGFGSIWWNPVLLTLAEQFLLNPSDRLMYDVFPVGGNFEVHRFVDQRDHTNVKIQKP